MDPLSITATCIALVSTITKTSLLVGSFVKDVRAARSDLDGVSRELLSLKTVLGLLADDVTDSTNESFPQTLQKQITGIIANCTGVVLDIEETLKKHEGGKLGKAAQWVVFGKNDVVKLRSSLEAHKSALEIALEMVTLTMVRGIKADTQELLHDTDAIKEDTAQILAQIARLQEQLPRDAQRNHTSGFMLERYLDNLTSYAETVCDTLSDNIDECRDGENGSIEQQRSTSPISRSSSIAREARINDNDHIAQSIAPWSPEDREGKFEDPEEYLKPEQDAADVARELTERKILRRSSTRRWRGANDHDGGQSGSLAPPNISAAAESRPEPNKSYARRTEYVSPRAQTQPLEQSRAQTPLIPTNSPRIKGPRNTMRERVAREARRDDIGRSRSVSVPRKDFQQKRQVSEAAVARNQIIAAHTAQSNSRRSDPQKQMDDVSRTENVYPRPPREPVGTGELSPGTDQNQSDGNALPRPRSATNNPFENESSNTKSSSDSDDQSSVPSVDSDVFIVVMGTTGAGKSSFINLVTGAGLVVGHTLFPSTQEIQTASTIIDERRVTFIDTPGFDDTYKDEAQVLSLISVWFRDSYKRGELINGIVYLHRITDNRVGGVGRRTMTTVQKIVGMDNYKSVALVTTFWDKMVGDELEKWGDKREDELEKNGDFWAPMIAKGAKKFRYDHRKDSALEIVRKILPQPPALLVLQRELDSEKSVAKTGAGKYMMEHLENETKRMDAFLTNVDEGEKKRDLLELKAGYQDDIKWMKMHIDRIIEDGRRDVAKQMKDGIAEGGGAAENEEDGGRIVGNMEESKSQPPRRSFWERLVDVVR